MTVEELLAAARASGSAGRSQRWQLRVEELGEDAVAPMTEWLGSGDEGLERFAIDVLGAMAAEGSATAFGALKGGEDCVSLGNVPHLVNARFDAARLAQPPVPEAPPGVSAQELQLGEGVEHGPDGIIARINGARRRRGEPELDSAEARHVLASLEAQAVHPDRYRNICWYCHAPVDAAMNERCRVCSWGICWCGACRDPRWRDRSGRSGACRRGAWAFANELPLPDRDLHGVAILTAAPPSPEAPAIRARLDGAGIRALYHWSPLRAIPTILEFGLLARPELEARGIEYVPHGFGNRAKEARLGQFVCLSARPKSRMMEAWSDRPVVWEVDPEVLTTEGTHFLPDNSARSDVELAEALAATGVGACGIALAALRIPTRQPEFLVPHRVPRAALVRAFVPDRAARHAIRREGDRLGWMVDVGDEAPDKVSPPPRPLLDWSGWTPYDL